MSEFEDGKLSISLDPVITGTSSSPPSPVRSGLTPVSSGMRRSKHNKRVSFTPDTHIPLDDNLALTITSHAYTKDLGYTQYNIDVSTCKYLGFLHIYIQLNKVFVQLMFLRIQNTQLKCTAYNMYNIISDCILI
jgi:hypothetical protein